MDNGELLYLISAIFGLFLMRFHKNGGSVVELITRKTRNKFNGKDNYAKHH